MLSDRYEDAEIMAVWRAMRERRVKIEGIKDCAEVLVAVLMPC